MTVPIMQKRSANIARNHQEMLRLGLAKGTETVVTVDSDDEEATVTEESETERDADVNERLVQSAEEVVKILSETMGASGRVTLKVLWDNGGVSEAPMGVIKKEFPVPLEEYLRKRGGGCVSNIGVPSPASSLTLSTVTTPPPTKKPRVENQVQSPVACGNKHESCTSFKMEEDGRYWDAGNSYHGMMCGACGDSCRRATARKPAYKCVDAETMGCMEIRCHGCYLDIVLERPPKQPKKIVEQDGVDSDTETVFEEN